MESIKPTKSYIDKDGSWIIEFKESEIMNNRNELDKQWYFTTFIKAIRFLLLVFMIGMVAIILFSCG